MSETTSRIIKIATKKRYKNKYHWTDYFSYFYLFLGVLLMFGPVVWLGLSSLKTLAGIQEYPPTILPLSQIQVDVEGYDKPLPIFNVTQEDGSVKQLAQIKRIGINAKMVDPLNPGETVKVPIDKREKIREFKIQWQNYVDPLRKYDFLLYFKNSTFITVVATIITLIINSMAAYALSIYCLLYTSPSPRDATLSRMPSSA